jgi:hypothetical protein
MAHQTETTLALAYLFAKKEVLRSRFAAELVEPLPEPMELDESSFLRELAWVILSSGMAEYVVRAKFPAITRSFLAWRSAREITDISETCVLSALTYFRHEAKIRAIAQSAQIVHRRSFCIIKQEILTDPINNLMAFPFIGPTTAFHLAKNVGVKVSKPDRHLSRLAASSGFAQVDEFCGCISSFLGEDIRMVDSVLWRFATLHQDYLDRFSGFVSA